MQPRQTEFGLGLFDGFEIVAVYEPNYLQSPEDLGSELEPMQITAFHNQQWHYCDITVQARFDGRVLGEIVRENFIYGFLPDPDNNGLPIDFTESDFWIPVKNELLEDRQHEHAIFEAKAFLNRANKLMEDK